MAEAAFFAAREFRDITYAVGIVPQKLSAVAALIREGVHVRVLTDDPDVAAALPTHARELGVDLHVLVEVDTGGGRGGVGPESERLVEIAAALHAAPGIHFDGVLTHAGQSYHSASVQEIARVAETERTGVVRAAERLAAARIPCSVVSAGSTPTAVHAAALPGITEMRPGNYVFYDLSQVGLGVCAIEDIAVSVLATVIGKTASGARLVDAGSLALSADTSANETSPGTGYGLVLDTQGRPFFGRNVRSVRIEKINQEHGFVIADPPLPPEALPIGARVRVLPNHSCITAAMHDVYHVLDGDNVVATWPRVRGW